MATFEDLTAFNTMDHMPFFRLAARHCGTTDRILDIGAGDGAFARTLGRPDIYLLEGNPDNAALLRKISSNVIEMSLPGNIPVRDGTFDVIHCSHIIEHFEHRDLYKLFVELDRCLAPGGRLIISTPLLYDGFYHDLSHIKPYSPVVLRSYFCGSTIGPRTRQPVAASYSEIDLKYRYRVVPMPFLNVSHAWRTLQRALYRISSILRRLNFGYYEITGYTMVLRKH